MGKSLKKSLLDFSKINDTHTVFLLIVGVYKGGTQSFKNSSHGLEGTAHDRSNYFAAFSGGFEDW